LAVTDWRLRRWRLWFLALMTATRFLLSFFFSLGLLFYFIFFFKKCIWQGEDSGYVRLVQVMKAARWGCSGVAERRK